MYWDANNLCGWAMNQSLPYCDFNFLTKKEICEFCLNSISEYSPKVAYSRSRSLMLQRIT